MHSWANTLIYLYIITKRGEGRGFPGVSENLSKFWFTII